MNKKHIERSKGWLISINFVICLVAGCTKTAEYCPSETVNLSVVQDYFVDEKLPFQFPLVTDTIFTSQFPFSAEFAAYGMTKRGPEYHAAEDILQPAGTPVYAIANGQVSFSGPMGGYGWLVIIDHPQADLYSLYGHLSPSRWHIETGSVKKGERVGYLGDPDENGGSAKDPMPPHLHLGIRIGQKKDYPGVGQWRWQAGWVKPCPQDLGWLQPSVVITSQDIHIGKSKAPTAGFLTIWWMELLITSFYIIAGFSMFVYAVKKNKIHILIITGIALIAAGCIFLKKGMIMSYLLFGMTAFFIVIGIYKKIRHKLVKVINSTRP